MSVGVRVELHFQIASDWIAEVRVAVAVAVAVPNMFGKLFVDAPFGDAVVVSGGASSHLHVFLGLRNSPESHTTCLIRPSGPSSYGLER